VTMHPQEYSVRDGLNYGNEVDMKQLQELEMLLDQIQSSGLRIVTIPQISDYIVVPEFHSVLLSVILAIPITALIVYKSRFVCWRLSK